MTKKTAGRKAVHNRKSGETDIKIKLNLDGTGKSKINTGIGFFDHMIEQLTKHSNMDLILSVKGDLHIDEHHTVEDVGIALGESINSALGDRRGIERYGFMLPMDDALAQCAIDLGGRVYLSFNVKFVREKIGEFPTELFQEFFRGFAAGLRANIHIKASGQNDHHKAEAVFKACARALNNAFKYDSRNKGSLPTTKGLI
ncbi:MAG: imidazoleglycerol-phosphate dehydratase HisB [Ignavibacteriae bacterium HGW-Ignavibacteriae-3]|nr:MAG: imidazoleglycerol-phosphate dehydratase HisB [Ignavibacteriae bacterium HGW-Ignavibacteriae-3]